MQLHMKVVQVAIYMEDTGPMQILFLRHYLLLKHLALKIALARQVLMLVIPQEVVAAVAGVGEFLPTKVQVHMLKMLMLQCPIVAPLTFQATKNALSRRMLYLKMLIWK